MEMNVSTQEQQVVARKTGGLNPFLVLPLLFIVGVCIYLFIFGSTGNFTHKGKEVSGVSVALLDIPLKELTPKSVMGMVYMGGMIVPVLITCAITVLVFSLERLFVLNKAEGAGNLEAFVLKIRQLLKENRISEAQEECDKQRGSVGNVVKEALITYKALSKETTMNRDQKMAALSKSIEEATTLEMPMMEKNMSILSTLGTVATLIALLGTVMGMIGAFYALGAGGGTPDAAALSIGISEALINTALGIGTSALAIILYNFFTSKIDGMTFKIDEIAMSIQQSFAETQR